MLVSNHKSHNYHFLQYYFQMVIDVTKGGVWIGFNGHLQIVTTSQYSTIAHSHAQQNHAGSKQKSYEIMRTKMFAILDKAKPDTGNTRGLNLAAVVCTAVQVSGLPLWREILVSSWT
jgi:hypothetical protein